MTNRILCWFVFMAAFNVHAAWDITKYSLEDLMSMTVSSVSKKEQVAFDATAAIYVITREDIRRSGATSLPELLRMAPGVQVSRIDGSRYAISIRGFSSRFSSKLLVLLDGRTLYTPLFGGVYWEAQDLILEDIARIEVIRGPGGTVWGANAVNGVINIITRSSQETQGEYFEAVLGEGYKGLSVRHGEMIGDDVFFRVFAKFDNHENLEQANGQDAYDEWDQKRAGFRADFSHNVHDVFTIQGDLYEKDARQTVGVSPPPFGFTSYEPDQADLSGGNLLFRWKRALSDEEDFFSRRITTMLRRKMRSLIKV